MPALWDVYSIAFDVVARLQPYQEMVNDVVSALAEVKVGGVLADLGCGTGNVLLAIKRARPDIRAIAVDVSQPMLNRCRSKSSPGLCVVADLALGVPIKSCSVDCAVMVNVLYALPPALRKQIVEDALRCVRPGGVLVVVNPTIGARSASVLSQHYRYEGLLGTLRLLPGLLVVRAFLSVIERRVQSGQFSYFSEEEMEALGCDEVSRTYAGQNVIGVLSIKSGT